MLRWLTVLCLGALALLAIPPSGSAQTPPTKQADPKLVRLYAVRTEFDSGLLDGLLAEFTAKTGYNITHVTGKTTYKELAKSGNVDVMLSHYRHDDMGWFVTNGYGLWPEPVMANVTAFLAPPDDPAHIKGLTSGFEMFQRIAAAKAPFVVNSDPNTRYLLETLWDAAGRPDKQGWYMDVGLEGVASAKRAVALHGYTIWGVTAFIQAKKDNDLPLDVVVPIDSVMQRVMLCVVANAAKFPRSNVNTAGAKALQAFLLSPAVQAKIAGYRYAGIDLPVFLPAGRNNENTVLEAVTEKAPTKP